jgi:hypothetical protein
MQDKLITGVHNKARQRREDILRATEEARRGAIEVLEEVGSPVLDESKLITSAIKAPYEPRLS